MSQTFKKFKIGVLSSLCLLTVCGGVANGKTSDRKEPVRTVVFKGGDFGSKFYRIPAIVTAKDGSIVAVADKRIESNADLPNPIDIVARRSTDGGKTWSDYITVAAHDSIGGTGDAAVVVDQNSGDILAIYSHGNGLWQDSPAQITVNRSKDNGITWGDTININPQILTTDSLGAQPIKATSAFATSGRALQLKDGRIIFALVTRKKGEPKFPVYAVYSDDGGYTWNVSKTPATVDGDESKIVELNDGTLIMSVRNRYRNKYMDNHRIFTYSKDRGETWSEPVAADLIDPACNGDIITYGDGEIVIHTLPDSPDKRENVSIFISRDNAKTFPEKKLVYEGPGAYSSVTVLPNGDLGVLTEEGHAEGEGYEIWFTSFDAEELGLTSSQPVKVGAIGNSITYGFLVKDREVNNYPTKLQGLLGEGYDVRNFGKSGATLLRKGHRPYFEQEEFADAMQFAPDIIMVHLGVNDTDPRDYPEYGDEFVADYVALIDSFKNVNPNVRVILANLSPLLSKHFRYRSGTRAWRDSLRQLIPVVAEVTGSELIDFGELLKNRPDLLPDGIHPNAEGASLMADYVNKAITGDFGGLALPEVYSDGMVLQRNKDLEIKGIANAGKNVTVTIGGNSKSAVASNDGKWSVTIPPMEAATGLTMTVTDGDQTLVFNDVAVGEVWLASGQSNMEYRLKNAKSFEEEKGNLNDPLLRLFDMKPVAYTDKIEWTEQQKQLTNNLKHYLPTSWKSSNDTTAPQFSAVAWYFGKMLRDSLDVPVGIISNAIGGSTAESWVDIESLEHNVPEILVNWRKNDYVQPWAQQRAGENTGTDDEGMKHRHPYEPSYLFSAGIDPLGSYPIKGVIWYQGESNAHNTLVHEMVFPVLVESWRNNWDNPDMPFLFTQLSSINRPSWPVFRDSQRRMSHQIPGVAMAVSSDQGDSIDVHPKNKKPIGLRLGRQALNRVYGMKNVVPEGPGPVKAISDGKNVKVLFTNADGLSTSDGKSPITFEVAEYEGLFYPAVAQITDDNSIILSSDEVTNPKIVRYGWQPFTRANLINGEGLPASTFKINVSQ